MRLLKNLTPVLGLALTVFAQEPAVLERYAFHLGIPNGPNQSTGAELRFTDRFFGNGTARSRIVLVAESSSSDQVNRPMMLSLQVARDVKEDEIVLALLVARVEIRGYNSSGVLIWSRDLRGFTFGDSSAGRWYERLAGLPTNVAQLTITFYGNYA